MRGVRTGGSSFSLVTSIVDGEHRVRPAGDLDVATRPRLEEALLYLTGTEPLLAFV